VSVLEVWMFPLGIIDSSITGLHFASPHQTVPFLFSWLVYSNFYKIKRFFSGRMHRNGVLAFFPLIKKYVSMNIKSLSDKLLFTENLQ
jgi:hypothetical protein